MQEGPTAVETHKIRSQLNALKSLALEEGISPQKIHKIIKKCDDKHNETILRVISRLLCNGSPELRIIPGCFDRWRQWVKYRQAMGYRLKYCNSFVNIWKRALSNAFNKWKTLTANYKTELQ
jgi:hypothetical protein